MRFDLRVIANWIEPGSRVLDLGCGAGALLDHLVRARRVRGTGVEHDEVRASAAIAKGLSVIHGDIFEETADYPDQSFDYVILSQTLQQVYEPDRLIAEMLRVGKRGVVSFPNFAVWYNRLMFLLLGRAPVSRELPYEWYDTPNIRVIPIKDFRRFCRAKHFAVEREVTITTHHHEEQGRVVAFLPNLRASYGIYLLSRGD